jgi:hypothetical protein
MTQFLDRVLERVREPVYETARLVERGSLKKRYVAVVSTPGRGEWVYAESEPFVVAERGWQKQGDLVNRLLREGWERIPTQVGYPQFRRRVK